MRLFISFLLLTSNLLSQTFNLTGNIRDIKTNLNLSFANLRVLNSSLGTAANIEGNYELKLGAGEYFITASFIGYKSDTLEIDLTDDMQLNFKLIPVSLELKEVTVLPGVNPAHAIIRRAINAKKNRNNKINDYVFNAYTKGLIKTTRDITTGDNSVSLDIGGADSAALKITGILENESSGYFKRPDNYKEEITARKQSANFPPFINTLTGGRIIQNFYADNIMFFNRDLMSPVADNALDFYFYILEDSLAYDNNKVYQIYFEPDDKSDPGFFGRIYITGDSYNLVKLDLNINDAANPGGILDKINIFQQYLPFDDDIYMPIDYRLFVEGNALGLFKFGFEINTILYDYKINKSIADDFFDMAFISVMPDADEKDSLYWTNAQTIPNTLEEASAYQRIDSLESIPKTFWDRFSFLSTRTYINENVDISGPLALYHFNRIEGNGLDLGIYINDLYNKRLDVSGDVSYGFADKKFKWNTGIEYYFGKYRTHSIAFDAYNKLNILFGESDEYNSLLPTLTSLFGKYDFKDYFYSKAIKIKYMGEVLPILELGLGFTYRQDKTAFLNSDFSFFNKDGNYDPNPAVMETTLHALNPGFRFDFRKYIEDGYYRRRSSLGKSYFILSGEALLSNKNILNSDLDFSIYQLEFYSYLRSFGFTNARIRIKSRWSDDALPFQMMYALPGNVESLGQNNTFRTVDFASVFGDKVVTVGLNYNFNDELFNLLNIPVIEDLQLSLGAHFNAGWSVISSKTKKLNETILNDELIEFKNPLYEIGFSLGQVMIPLRIEFTWRINHRSTNQFVFGINSVAF